jgi:hypothetical protein
VGDERRTNVGVDEDGGSPPIARALWAGVELGALGIETGFTTPAIFSICTVSGGRLAGDVDILFASESSVGSGGSGGTGPRGLFHKSSESESSNVPVDILVAVEASYVSNADELKFAKGNALNEGREEGWRVVDMDVSDEMAFGKVVVDP